MTAAFSAAAKTYDAGAEVQRRVAGSLAQRIKRLSLNAPRVLEIGCGTGLLSRTLLDLAPRALVLTDIAPAMIAHCRAALPENNCTRFVVMDGEAPENVGGGFDLICSSMTFQWFDDIAASLPRLAGFLAPGGHLAFATLAAGSFREWRAAHEALGLSAATRSYPTADTLRTMLPGLDVGEENLTQHYADGHSFLAQLKQIGAHVPKEDRKPLGVGALRRVLRQFADGIDVTYHVAYGMWTSPSVP